MKRWLWIAVACAVLPLGYVATRHEVRRVTNKTFQEGQCTWYALERANEAGWKIRFDQPYGRHARYWPERVVNARLVKEPVAGELMILDQWPGNPYGHVAFVESVKDKDHWTISHANMAAGTEDRTLDGQTIRVANVARSGSLIVFDGRSAAFPLLGFLQRRT